MTSICLHSYVCEKTSSSRFHRLSSETSNFLKSTLQKRQLTMEALRPITNVIIIPHPHSERLSFVWRQRWLPRGYKFCEYLVLKSNRWIEFDEIRNLNLFFFVLSSSVSQFSQTLINSQREKQKLFHQQNISGRLCAPWRCISCRC